MRRALYPRPTLPVRRGLLALAVAAGIDALLEDRGRLEHHHATRRDRHFLAGLRIAPDALALLAHHERTERRQLHGLAAREAVRDFLQYHFNECRRFRSRQSDLLVDSLAQVRPRHCFARHRLSPPSATSNYPHEFSTIFTCRGDGQRPCLECDGAFLNGNDRAFRIRPVTSAREPRPR